ncbi:probable calcium-binding protein CML36 [Humulus lupulus]|uniref:probable calcium-binding protein CML36 n=1 Tax=Humulus lupulus TaxID=3486 RepID=UPI002B410462|nr:probable calcium-binding protein CML36 [Humulus lupulus]
MKFVKNLKLSPKRLFRSSKADKLSPSKSDPPSFGSGSSTSSSSLSDASTSDNLKSGPTNGGSVTPTSVLRDWPDYSTDSHLELNQAFKLIDRDNDGIVSRKEIEALLLLVGGWTSEVVATMLSEVDHDGDGSISVEALMSRVGPAACEPAGDSESELQEVFNFFDQDRDGKISAEELLSFFETIGDDRCTLDDCRRMIDGVDKNGDGFVCFEDFSRMMELQRLS